MVFGAGGAPGWYPSILMWCDIPVSSAQQVGFSILVPAGSGIGKNNSKQVGFGLGRSVEIYNRVFSVFFLLSGIPG